MKTKEELNALKKEVEAVSKNRLFFSDCISQYKGDKCMVENQEFMD